MVICALSIVNKSRDSPHLAPEPNLESICDLSQSLTESTTHGMEQLLHSVKHRYDRDPSILVPTAFCKHLRGHRLTHSKISHVNEPSNRLSGHHDRIYTPARREQYLESLPLLSRVTRVYRQCGPRYYTASSSKCVIHQLSYLTVVVRTEREMRVRFISENGN